MRDEPSETLAAIQDAELCEEVHQAVAGGCAGQADDAADAVAYLQQAFESLGGVTLEAGKLVNDDHVVLKRDAALLNEPLHVLAVDDVDVSLLHQRCTALFLAADRYAVGQAFEVVPLPDLCRPCVPGDAERGNDQDAVDIEAVKHQAVDGGQRDDALAKSHLEQDCRDRVVDDELGCELLIFMWLIFHQAHLRFALCCL